MQKTPERVLALAEQARIGLTDEEAQQMVPRLASVLEAAAELQQVDTSGVEAEVPMSDAVNVLRDDIVGPSLPREEVLAGAPDVQDGMFKVPRLHEQ